MEIRKSNSKIIVLFVVLFLIGIATALYAQEATETAPETAITEETATTTPTTPRIVSLELLTELKARQADFEDAQKLVNYVLEKIIIEYQVDIRAEVINIDTGEITPRQTATQ
jgi:hypothetical protein